jgi:hypothetical protein
VIVQLLLPRLSLTAWRGSLKLPSAETGTVGAGARVETFLSSTRAALARIDSADIEEFDVRPATIASGLL